MKTVRFLVVDYDDTAYSYDSKRDDYLSQPIVDMATNGKYDGFYGCTHRGYSTINYLRLRTIRAGFSCKALDGFPTYRVTENFAKATSLPLQAVSTLDDVQEHNIDKGVGYGFENILKPYEKDGQWADEGEYFLRKRDYLRYPATKNPQLLQIAQHAVKNHPDTIVILDYVDDNAKNCEQALTAMEQDNWPKSVCLRIHLYTPEREIRLLKEPEIYSGAESDLEDPIITPLLAHGLFMLQPRKPGLAAATITSSKMI